jgi:ubiquinone/menaquinone biosynthesis C-methylase UbiE
MRIVNSIQLSSVSTAFDSVAEIFEQTLENDITRGLRQKVYATVEQLIPPGSRILDINCGIGIDAVALAERGYNVVGLDIAPKMIEKAKQRVERSGVTTAEFFVGSFEDLSPLTGQTFDLVLSNFGGLNCVGSLDIVAEQVARVVRPNGFFVAMVMPPICLWEILAGLARLNFKLAFRRLQKNVQATGFQGGTFTVSYFSPRTIAASFVKWFAVKQVRGLNIISPPPHASRFKTANPKLCSILEQVEKKVDRIPFLRNAGDHYLMVMKKVENHNF